MSHEQPLRWTNVHNRQGLTKFMGDYFDLRITPFYSEHVAMNLFNHPERTNNPLYIGFAARVLLMAAEYQFPELVNHETRHENHKWRARDFMSPLHLLALGVYLSQLTVRNVEAKISILKTWEHEDASFLREHVPELLDAWVLPKDAFPAAAAFLTKPKPYRDGRARTNLPVLIPDVPFLRQVATIPFTGDQADTIRRREFEATILPLAGRVFFPQEDREAVSRLFASDFAKE